MQSSSELTTYDFEVEIGIGKGLEYPVAVIRSPAGEVHETASETAHPGPETCLSPLGIHVWI
jgi:hypothetical protein